MNPSISNDGGASGAAQSDRDSREGRFTQVDPQPAAVRTVHGQYTWTDSDAHLDGNAEGKYVGSETVGRSDPKVGDTHDRHGNYPKSEQAATATRSRPRSTRS